MKTRNKISMRYRSKPPRLCCLVLHRGLSCTEVLITLHPVTLEKFTITTISPRKNCSSYKPCVQCRLKDRM